MEEQQIKRIRHKWDCLDTCIKCGVKRQTKPLYVKSMSIKKGNIIEYFVNNEWTTNIPNCIK